MQYQIELEREEDGRWIAEVPDLPGSTHLRAVARRGGDACAGTRPARDYGAPGESGAGRPSFWSSVFVPPRLR
jgi:hypothetical protein